MPMPHVFSLADNGSDRATAYHMSNKVLHHRDGTFVTWLDDQYRTMLAQVDPDTGTVRQAFPLAQGWDNHCGAALAQTPDGALHLMAGAHAAGAFIHRASRTPADPGSWSLPQAVGWAPTYPSLVALSDGALVLAHRHTPLEGHWHAQLTRRPPGQDWGWPLALTRAPAPLYTFTTNALTLGPDGVLHIVVEFFKTYPNNVDAARSPAVTHLYSPDGGVTWHHDDGRLVKKVPVCLEDTPLIAHDAAGSLRPGNLLALADGRLVCGIWNQFNADAFLMLRRAPGQWARLGLTEEIRRRVNPGIVTSQLQLGLDTDGSVLVVTTVAAEADWSAPTNQVLCLWFDPATERLTRHCLVPQLIPGQSNWLPSVERHGGGVPPSRSPLILFTDGNRGPGLADHTRCGVRLLRLD